MKFFLAFSLAALAAVAAELPKKAVQTAPGVYSFTDAQGKKWIYRATPFGMARMEDKPAATAQPARSEADIIRASDAGEFVKFERPGPFGTYQWQTRKSDLTPAERAAWEKSNSKKD